MALTGTDICTDALRHSGVCGVGNPPDAEQITDALRLLNNMLAVWSSKRWLDYALLDFAITSTGAQSYTIGPGGDIVVASRPDRIEAAYVRISNAGGLPVDYPLDQVLSREDYSRVPLKTLRSFPSAYFYDSGFPLGRIFPLPVAQASIYELHVLTRVILPVLAVPATQIILPPQYNDAMTWNMARRCRAAWRLPPDREINALAQDGLNTIRSANVQVPTMQLPAGLGGSIGNYNPFSDTMYTVN